MAGETILIVDDSVGAQDIAKRILELAGYRVIEAGNGVAAFVCPEIATVDLAIVDTDMPGFDGEETIKSMRAAQASHGVPILLLVPEAKAEARASQSLHGANGYLLKPYEPEFLLRKARTLIEERRLEEEAAEYLQQAAEAKMREMAAQSIQSAIEKRTQIIVERMIQNVVAMVDQQARREVEAKITAVSAEKEQELVKITVREVAQSAVDKLAERKVAEAMEKILEDQTARAVKRGIDSTLPGMIRERLRESIDNTLPRELDRRLNSAVEQIAPQISTQLVQTVEGLAQQIVPKVSRERLPEMLERQIAAALQERVPAVVRDLIDRDLSAQIRSKVDPAIDGARARINRRLKLASILLAVLVVALTAVNGYFCYLQFFSQK